MKEEEFEHKMAKNNVTLCHQIKLIHFNKGELENKKYQQRAFGIINEAIAVFTKLSDIGSLARAYKQRAGIKPCTPEHQEEQLEDFRKAHDLCLQAYGKSHKLYRSICWNYAALYEHNGDYEKGYDYTVLALETALNIYGPDHPKTVQASEHLKHDFYENIRKERERTSAGTA